MYSRLFIRNALVLDRYGFRRPVIFTHISLNFPLFYFKIFIHLVYHNPPEQEIKCNTGQQENEQGCKQVDTEISGEKFHG